MVDKECNLRAGVYKVQTFGTTHNFNRPDKFLYFMIQSILLERSKIVGD